MILVKVGSKFLSTHWLVSMLDLDSLIDKYLKKLCLMSAVFMLSAKKKV